MNPAPTKTITQRDEHGTLVEVEVTRCAATVSGGSQCPYTVTGSGAGPGVVVLLEDGITVGWLCDYHKDRSV
jgi:hypothetical protein